MLGNGEFGFVLRNAPTNYASAAFAVGFTPCRGPGIDLGFCSRVTVALGPFRPLLFFFNGPARGAGCTGSVLVPLQIPVSRALCGFDMSVQWVLGCPSGGNAVTQCLSMKLQ